MNLLSDINTEPLAPAAAAEPRNSSNTTQSQQNTETTPQRSPAPRAKPNKIQTVITLLRRKKGATINELVKATGWQQHSIRGLISGTIKKKLLFNVVAEKGGKSGARYRIVTAKGAK